MIGSGIEKFRYLAATRPGTLRRIGILLVLVGLVGAAVTLAFPPTATVTEVTDQSTVETATGTTATVEDDYQFYDEGETLSDEPVYVRNVAPEVTVTATTTAPPDGVAVEQRLSLVYEASAAGTGTFRQRSRTLGETTGVVDGDEPVRTEATLRIADVEERLAAMETEIGDAGDVDVYLAVETTYESRTFDGRMQDRERISIDEGSYRIPTPSVSERHRSTETVERPIPDRVFRPSVLGIGAVVVPHTTAAFAALLLIGVATVGAVRRLRGRVDPDREAVAIHRRRYDEWISRGEIPYALLERSHVIHLETLEDLVDVAIDADTRVVYDGSLDCYAVITGDAVYAFSADDRD